jgi:hypothetical protein
LVHERELAELKVTGVQAAPSIVTVAPEMKSEPVIVRVVPPANAPALGVTSVGFGAKE